MARFVHTSDWQLGMTRYFLEPDAQARFTQSRFGVIRKIGELAKAEEAAFVVVAGDVFESNLLDRRTIARALEAMRSTPVPFYLLPGNHDPLDSSSVYTSKGFAANQPPNVHILADNIPVAPAPGVELIGAPWTSKRPLSDLVFQACHQLGESATTTRIAVGHGGIDTLSPDPTDPALIHLGQAEGLIQQGRIQYLALGDHHSAQRIGTSGRIWYSGAPEPTDFDEDRPGRVLLVDTDQDSCEVEEVPTAEWHFGQRHFDLGGTEDLGRMDEFLRQNEAKEFTILRLSMRGTLDLGAHAQLDGVLDHYRNLYGALQVWDEKTQIVLMPSQADLERLNLAGWAKDALADLTKKAQHPENDQTAQDALGLLYRLAKGEVE